MHPDKLRSVLGDVAKGKMDIDAAVEALKTLPYEDLGEILACGDVMLLPYTNRSINIARFPNRSGDYLAAGRPIATNLTGDLGQIIMGHDVGIVAPDEPEPFAAAIQTLLKNPSLMAEMGTRARRLAESQFSWLALAKKLDQFYQYVVSDHNAVESSHKKSTKSLIE